MENLIKNDQKFIARQCLMNDTQVNKTSNDAVLIIKRWKLIRKITLPVAGQIVQAHTERLIIKSFFTYVPNRLLLMQGACFNDLKN